MMKKISLMFLFVIVLLVLFQFGCTSKELTPQTSESKESKESTQTPAESKPPVQVTTPDPAPSTPTPAEEQKITQAELSTHNSQNDCWISYEGEIFDITSYLPKHPGGIGAIKPYCGTSDEFTQAFLGMHGTSKVGALKKQGLFKGNLA